MLIGPQEMPEECSMQKRPQKGAVGVAVAGGVASYPGESKVIRERNVNQWQGRQFNLAAWHNLTKATAATGRFSGL